MSDRIKIKYWWSEDKKWFCVLVDDGASQSTVSLTPEEASLLSMNAVLEESEGAAQGRLHPLSEIREWDEALAVLGIQDSDQTPADAIRELNDEIERLRSSPQATALDPADAVYYEGYEQARSDLSPAVAQARCTCGSDFEQVLAGCSYDNEALLKAIADLKRAPAQSSRDAVIKECIEAIERRFLVGWTITPNGLAREDEANEILETIRGLALPSTDQRCPECEANGLCARHAVTSTNQLPVITKGLVPDSNSASGYTVPPAHRGGEA